ncbi:hypothetical protein SY88_06525 [Clostridiales bacterium PH28_bin88]|nr:hypothetical protein SY88_06525 [Clostridiales bacterium PH28_bin88]
MVLDRLFELVRLLAAIPGPVGHEDAVIMTLQGLWRPFVEEIWVDRLGNLTCKVGGKGPKILLSAHADEYCFVVKGVTLEGFLAIDSGQSYRNGPDTARAFLGHPALVLTPEGGRFEGVFGTTTGHLASYIDLGRGFKWEYVFVDIGIESYKQAESQGITVGSRIISNSPIRRLGDRVVGKALDDRIGLAIITVLLERITPNCLGVELYIRVSTQEEIDSVGASVEQSIHPDLCIVLDVGPVGDIPPLKNHGISTGLGKGPILVHKDSNVHYHRKSVQSLTKLAHGSGIPLQHAVYVGYGTDGLEFTKKGIPSMVVAIPTRYTHSPFEMVSLVDAEITLALLQECIKSLGVE